MAQKLRLVVKDGLYNVTTRVANRQLLLNDALFRDRVANWIYGIADFCGVEVMCWCIMENHLHLALYVPEVPERYWNKADARPRTEAFSMRPRECHAQRFQPDVNDELPVITPAGDKASRAAVLQAISDGVPLVILPRPETGFTLSDEEMARRLEMLFDNYSNRAAKILKRWRRLRAAGGDATVEQEKEALCRHMYNISQYMKLLKQRISEVYNRETGHVGTLWESRFRSGLIGDSTQDRLMVASYFAWNPKKAGMVYGPEAWRWSSYAAACDESSPWHDRAVAAYERCFGRKWADIHARLQSLFAEKLPEWCDSTRDPLSYERKLPDGGTEKVHFTMGQAIKMKIAMFERGGFISQDIEFMHRMCAQVHPRFPVPSAKSIRYFQNFEWKADAAIAM